MQEILSNVCAPPTHETLVILRTMHPCGSGTRRTSPSVSQVSVSTRKAKAMLFKLAGKGRPSEDCFGWSACLLYPLQGQRTRGRFIPFFQQVARLVSRIASADVPGPAGPAGPPRPARSSALDGKARRTVEEFCEFTAAGSGVNNALMF